MRERAVDQGECEKARSEKEGSVMTHALSHTHTHTHTYTHMYVWYTPHIAVHINARINNKRCPTILTTRHDDAEVDDDEAGRGSSMIVALPLR
jgi:ABC-type Zn2+ transport system substrate-binding protein/surface adhesin